MRRPMRQARTVGHWRIARARLSRIAAFVSGPTDGPGWNRTVCAIIESRRRVRPGREVFLQGRDRQVPGRPAAGPRGPRGRNPDGRL